MSKVKIQGNASGTGVVTLTAPNTNTDRTITLPDETVSLTGAPAGLDDVGGVARATSGLLFNGDTAAANALDDYEEGTWTPVIVGRTTAGAATYTIQTGRYTKIGNVVHIECRLGWSAHTGTGTTQINGLPFTNNDHYANLSIVHRDGLTVSSSHYVNLSIVPNQSYMYVLETSTGTDYAAILALDTNVPDMAFSGTYTV